MRDGAERWSQVSWPQEPAPSEAVSRDLAAVARRAAAGHLACPYCQDALRVVWLARDRLQLRCPTCGFTEAPDLAEGGGS